MNVKTPFVHFSLLSFCAISKSNDLLFDTMKVKMSMLPFAIDLQNNWFYKLNACNFKFQCHLAVNIGDKKCSNNSLQHNKNKETWRFLYKHVEATHRRNEGMLAMKKYVMCNKVRCHFTKNKFRWLLSLEKRSSYGDGDGWEVVACQDWWN